MDPSFQIHTKKRRKQKLKIKNWKENKAFLPF